MDFTNHGRLHLGSKPKIFSFAKGLRKDSTGAEEILWKQIRNKRILGYKFRRQHPLNKYIADFYCHEANLVIELDGEIHNDTKEYDANRTNALNEFGIKVIRFTNEEILENLNSVIAAIHFELQNHLFNRPNSVIEDISASQVSDI